MKVDYDTQKSPNPDEIEMFNSSRFVTAIIVIATLVFVGLAFGVQ